MTGNNIAFIFLLHFKSIYKSISSPTTILKSPDKHYFPMFASLQLAKVPSFSVK